MLTFRKMLALTRFRLGLGAVLAAVGAWGLFEFLRGMFVIILAKDVFQLEPWGFPYFLGLWAGPGLLVMAALSWRRARAAQNRMRWGWTAWALLLGAVGLYFVIDVVRNRIESVRWDLDHPISSEAGWTYVGIRLLRFVHDIEDFSASPALVCGLWLLLTATLGRSARRGRTP